MAEKILVTGGNGFLGRALLRQLRECGCRDLVSLGRSRPQANGGPDCVTFQQGDLRDADALRRACAGRTLIFHVAARTGVWGPAREFHETNVGGTRNLIAAARTAGASALVLVSSPSVAYDPCRHAAGINESAPPPRRYLSPYPATKALAETEALAANHANFAVTALRPHLLWGPGDPHLLPRIVELARRGKLCRVGDGRNRVTLTYVDNAARALLLAAENLRDSRTAAGRAYFIGDEPPVVLWDWLNHLLQALGLPEVRRAMSFATAYRFGAMLESVYQWLPGRPEPPMTRFIAGQLAHDHWFDLTAAKRDLRLAPVVSPAEAMADTLAWLREQTDRSEL